MHFWINLIEENPFYKYIQWEKEMNLDFFIEFFVYLIENEDYSLDQKMIAIKSILFDFDDDSFKSPGFCYKNCKDWLWELINEPEILEYIKNPRLCYSEEMFQCIIDSRMRQLGIRINNERYHDFIKFETNRMYRQFLYEGEKDFVMIEWKVREYYNKDKKYKFL